MKLRLQESEQENGFSPKTRKKLFMGISIGLLVLALCSYGAFFLIPGNPVLFLFLPPLLLVIRFIFALFDGEDSEFYIYGGCFILSVVISIFLYDEKEAEIFYEKMSQLQEQIEQEEQERKDNLQQEILEMSGGGHYLRVDSMRT